MAMVGKNCVAIASDKRLGLQAMTVGKEFPKVFPLGPRLYLGLSGLATDIQTLRERLTYSLNIFCLREERDITSKQFAHLVSSTLYAKRFGPYYAEPIVAGLDYDPSTEEWKPFICSMDVIGCINWAKDFVLGGTASTSLYGMCECLYEPDLVSRYFNCRNLNNCLKLFRKHSSMLVTATP